jgi:hypothetical protein
MRARHGVSPLAIVACLFAARAAAASPDPYSPAQTPPPPAFFASYEAAVVTTSYVPRSPAFKAVGVALIIAGGVALVAAPIVGTAGTSPAYDAGLPAPTDGAVLGLAVGGLGLLAVGIPTAVYGATLVPPPSVALGRAARLEPSAGGLRVVF